VRSLSRVDGIGYGSAWLDVGGPTHGERDGEANALGADRGIIVKLASDGAQLTEKDGGGGVSSSDGDPARQR
jgi:hypothetical protein